MILEFTVSLPNGDSFKEKITASDENEGRSILEAKYGPGTVPYSCKVMSL